MLKKFAGKMTDKVQGGCCLLELKGLLPMDNCNDCDFDDFQRFINKHSKRPLGKMGTRRVKWDDKNWKTSKNVDSQNFL